jgi:formylglycine-generating enzyme required for sulfatase activity
MGTNSKPPLLEKGDVLNGKWEIREHIATGGIAEVYRARQVRLDREVAVKVNAFYLEETEVTNHQYVEFLNQVLQRVRVEDGVVKRDGHVWLLLGEVTKAYEPIVFKEGRFFVNMSFCPS